jgi:hypothetical protein
MSNVVCVYLHETVILGAKVGNNGVLETLKDKVGFITLHVIQLLL